MVGQGGERTRGDHILIDNSLGRLITNALLAVGRATEGAENEALLLQSGNQTLHILHRGDVRQLLLDGAREHEVVDLV